MKSIALRVVNASLVRILGAGANFILIVYITRQLGASETAPFFFMLGIVPFLTTFATAGQHIYSIKLLAPNKSNEQVYRYLKFSFSLVIVTTLIIWNIFYLAVSHFEIVSAQNISGFIGPVLFSSSTVIIIGAVYQANDRMVKAAFIQFVFMPFVILFALFILKPATTAELMHAYATLSFFVGGFLWIAAIRSFSCSDCEKIKISDYFSLIVAGSTFLLPNILGQISNFSIQFIIGKNGGPDASLFGVCLRISLVVGMLYYGLGRIILPYFSRLYADKNFLVLRKTYVAIISICVPIVIGMFSLLYYFAPLLINLFGSEFVRATDCLRVILIGQCISVLGLVNSGLLQMCGEEKPLARVSLVATVFVLILVIPAINQYGILGGAYIYTLNYFLLNMGSLYLSIKLLMKLKDRRRFD